MIHQHFFTVLFDAMPWHRGLACLLILVLAATPVLANDSTSTESLNKFCIVVRTYRGHADAETGLPRLLRSLQRQSFSRRVVPGWFPLCKSCWTALL